ncbi:acyl-CoA N-acyltransferase, partial [Trichophaea hybrida]
LQILSTNSSRVNNVRSRSAGAKGKDVSAVVLGTHLMKPWYASSYKEKLLGDACRKDGRLYVCEYCFKYSPDISRMMGHQKFCPLAQSGALGTCVYTGNGYEIHEVDGSEHPLFCQNLCLFANCFSTLNLCATKSNLLFYTLVETSPDTGYQHVVGFFSKERISWDDYNLACILVFPPYQRRGLGKLLISFSYELSKMNTRWALSIGPQGYIAYWSSCIAQTIMQTSQDTISSALDSMGVLVPDAQSGAAHIRMDKWKRGMNLVMRPVKA